MVSTGIERFFGGLLGVLGGAGGMYLAETVQPGDWLYPDRGLMFWAAVAAVVAGLGFMVWGIATVIIGLVARKRKKKTASTPPPVNRLRSFWKNVESYGNKGAGFHFGRGAELPDMEDVSAHDNEAGGFVVEGDAPESPPKPSGAR